MIKNIHTNFLRKKKIITYLTLILFFTQCLQSQDLVWKRTFDSGSSDYGWDVCTDSAGNIIVTGSSYGDVNNSDFLTIKYNNDGDTIWTRRFHNHSNEYANGVAADSLGNIIVTGCTSTESTAADYCTIKYSPSGDLLWMRTYTSDSAKLDEAYGVATDSKGSVIVTGSIENKNSSFDYLTIKYDSNGNILWTKTYNYAFSDKAQAVTVDQGGNVYVTGYSADSGGAYDWCTIKYNKDGEFVWVKREDTYTDGHACCITVDKSDGEILVGGSMINCDLLKYDNDSGIFIWRKTYMNQGVIRDITSDENGFIYLENWHSITPTGGSVFFTIKCDSLGNILWSESYQEGFDNKGMGICLDMYGNIIITGTYDVDSINGNANYLTIKYNSATGLTDEDLSNIPPQYCLDQNYPNPFNPTTTIRYELPSLAHVQLKVYSLMGQEVVTLIDGIENPGYHEVEWDASAQAGGVYFIKFTAGSYIKVRKMLSIK